MKIHPVSCIFFYKALKKKDLAEAWEVRFQNRLLKTNQTSIRNSMWYYGILLSEVNTYKIIKTGVLEIGMVIFINSMCKKIF